MDYSNEMSFDKLPQAVSRLFIELTEIKGLLVNNNSRGKPTHNKLSMDKTIEFFQENGYLISISKLYKLTSKKEIPFYKFGQRIVFDKSELIIWLDTQTKSSDKSKNDSIKMISDSANIKLNRKK